MFNKSITSILEKSNIFAEYKKIMNLYMDPSKINTFLRIVERYREYLREKRADSFSLSPLQVILVGGKAKRLELKEQYTNLLWQLRGEAFWLYLLDSNNQSFDDYILQLPLSLQDGLAELGFNQLELSEIEKLVTLSDVLMKKAESSI